MGLTDNILAIDYSKYACNVYLNGIALPEYYEIISIQIKQGFQHITSAEIYIKQDVGFYNPTIPEPFVKPPLAGTQISIKAHYSGDEIVLFEGYIVKHKYKNSTKGTRLKLTAKNKVVIMSMNDKTEVFSKQIDRDIIETICQNNGMRLELDKNISSQLNIMHTQSVKHQLSDWDYINQTAEANSCFIYSENETVHIVYPKIVNNPLDIFTVNYGENVFEIELEQDDRSNQIENELISFDVSTLEAVTTTSDDFDAMVLSSTITGKATTINYRTFNEMEAKNLLDAKNQLKEISKFNGLVHIHANLKPKPGDTIQIHGFNELTDQKYIITSVLQDYSEGGLSTYLQFGLNHKSFANTFHKTADKNRPLIISGIVQQIENDPDNLFRILVQIPEWKDAQEGVWARHSTSYAGNDYGLIMLPEIGDEVLLSFIGNDYDAPLIIGSVFSPVNPPITNYEDNNYIKALITKNGMKWSWDDDKGIHEISTPSGNKILLSEDNNSVEIEDQSGNKIEMTNSGIAIESVGDLKLTAATEIKIEATSIEISASAINTIKGGIVKIN
ncbi:MAG TPA: phage baseplate assembly protein V [Edaphocola sp.]|nr:phage baseplate assembly protein V [Edaphocola sp.]